MISFPLPSSFVTLFSKIWSNTFVTLSLKRPHFHFYKHFFILFYLFISNMQNSTTTAVAENI